MILLIGFEKFGQYSQNPSEQIVRSFPDKIQNQVFIKKILPVSWKRCITIYRDLIRTRKCSLVILTGVYTGKTILIEKFGWNLAFGLDNYHQFKLGFIRLPKPIRLKSIINLVDLFNHLPDQNNILISSYAGSYLCNFLYYWALFLAQKNYPVIFIHIPAKSNLEIIKERISQIIEALINILFIN
ncbi:MAG: hypothetical protein ACFFFB_01705 [Candidatus Heimdallarchaeota archaeon]